jgi:hypothetical protein
MSVATVLSIVMFAAIALVLGAIALWRRGAPRLQIALMLLLAAIMAGNVAIWVIPAKDGTSLVQAER